MSEGKAIPPEYKERLDLLMEWLKSVFMARDGEYMARIRTTADDAFTCVSLEKDAPDDVKVLAALTVVGFGAVWESMLDEINRGEGK